MEYNELQLPAQKILDKLGLKYRVKFNNHFQQKMRAKANIKFSGLPDIEVFFRNGLNVFFEFKVEKNKLSQVQLDWKTYLEEFGYPYYEIRDIKEFTKIVERYI